MLNARISGQNFGEIARVKGEIYAHVFQQYQQALIGFRRCLGFFPIRAAGKRTAVSPKCNTGTRNGSQRPRYLLCADDTVISRVHVSFGGCKLDPSSLTAWSLQKYYWFCLEITGISSRVFFFVFIWVFTQTENFKYQSSCAKRSVWSRVPSMSSAS